MFARPGNSSLHLPIITIIPDFLIAVLATWLGASVVTLTLRESASRVFGLLTLLTMLWATSRVVGTLTDAAAVVRGAARTENAVSALLPAALLHIVLVFTVGRRLSWMQRAALLAAYVVSGCVVLIFQSGIGRRISVRGTDRSIL